MCKVLRYLRRRRGLKQSEIALIVNASQQAVSKWERGETEPDTDTIRTLAELYGVSVADIVGNKSVPDNDGSLPFADSAMDRFRRIIETLNDAQTAFLLDIVEDVAQGAAIQSLK